MSNVVEFKREDSFLEHVSTWLEEYESENTRIRYENNIKMFTNWKFKNIDIKQITPEHINSIMYVDIKKFKMYLQNKKYAASTVNGTLFSLYSLFKELNKIQNSKGEYLYTLHVDRLRVKASTLKDQESAGDVSYEEVQEWIEYIKSSDMSRKENKWIFFHIAITTGLRKQALSNMRYKDLKKNAEGIWRLKSTLKTTTKYLSLKDEDAELLLSLRKNNMDKDEKILKMSTKSMERLMKLISEEMQIDPDRNVSLHSLRGLSIYESYLASNDILVSQSHAGHSSMETTYNYVKSRADAKDDVTLYMNKEFSEKDVDGLDQEQWKNIYRELSRSSKYEIDRIKKELGYSQE